MPKELFYTIAPEKRERLIRVSMDEFSQNLFHEVSINQIVKKVDIARGSFYQYFEDKEDLYFFIINKILYEKMSEFTALISDEEMDIFSIYRKIFILNLKMLSDDRYKSFFKNLYLSMNYKLEQRFRDVMDEIKDKAFQKHFYRFILQNQNQQESFLELNKMINIISMNLRKQKIANNLPDEEVMRIYDIQMKILKGEVRF